VSDGFKPAATPAQPGSVQAGGQDRRAHPRKPLRTSAVLTLAGRQLPARTLDISKEGLAITTDVNMAPGTACSVGFSLVAGGTSRPLQLQARVVDTVLSAQGGFRTGLLLGQVSAEHKRVIELFLAG
jgi:hypothetical protein